MHHQVLPYQLPAAQVGLGVDRERIAGQGSGKRLQRTGLVASTTSHSLLLTH